ncbi:putative non-ribosomal peptide synthetase [Mycobacterium xenopi 4042]|uniref:Putative non-ribosomal peptide synthetase n=1 Tax=Mycobacterium xenopi 4042 TaxID=1299334 RepID=X8AQT9_MYCXE|nr:putative non-ribosomal peptide synthetase [Mycobacterium xenopi 4042]
MLDGLEAPTLLCPARRRGQAGATLDRCGCRPIPPARLANWPVARTRPSTPCCKPLTRSCCAG